MTLRLHQDHASEYANVENGVADALRKSMAAARRRASRNDGEWPELDTFKFIEVYETEPVIWDPNHSAHSDRGEMHEAWRRIQKALAKQTGCSRSVQDLKKKKDSLMSSFRRLQSKALREAEGGADDVFKPEWTFFDSMARFLSAVYEPRQYKVKNVDQSNEPSDTDSEVSAARSTSPVQHQRKRKRDTREDMMEFMRSCTAVMTSVSSKCDCSEAEAVGINVVSKLEKMNSKQQIYAELLIHKVLAKGLLNQLMEATDVR